MQKLCKTQAVATTAADSWRSDTPRYLRPLKRFIVSCLSCPLVRELVLVLGSSKVIQTAKKTHFPKGIQSGPGLTLTLTTGTSDKWTLGQVNPRTTGRTPLKRPFSEPNACSITTRVELRTTLNSFCRFVK